MTAEFRYDENEMKEVASKALNDYYAALLEKIDNLDLRDVLKKRILIFIGQRGWRRQQIL